MSQRFSLLATRATTVLAAWLVTACGFSGASPIDANSEQADDATSDGPNQSNPDASTGDAAPVGHDEDSDGIPDLTDNCPHRANTDQANDDGDGVGNVCDPSTNQHRIALFLPMFGLTPQSFTAVAGTVELEADSVLVGAINAATPGSGYFTSSISINESITIIVDFTIVEVGSIAPGQNQRIVNFGSAPAKANLTYAANIYQDGVRNISVWTVNRFNSTTNQVTAFESDDIPTNLPLVRGSIAQVLSTRVDPPVDGPNSARLLLGNIDESATTNVNYAGIDRVGFYAANAKIRVHSMTVIARQP